MTEFTEFELKIKKFYDLGLYTKEMVHKFVEKGALSEEKYKKICGIPDEVIPEVESETIPEVEPEEATEPETAGE